MEAIKLSIILPTNGGGKRLTMAVAEALALAGEALSTYELIIVDDASDHETARIADRLAATHQHVALLRFTRRLGYRRALHDAWGAASGQYIAALDLSGPASLRELPQLCAAAPGHAVVLGYRERPTHSLRELIFNTTARRIAPEVRDPALGLALFHADQRDLIATAGPDRLTHIAAYAAAQQRGLPVTQVSIKAQTPLAPSSSPSSALGVGMLVAAGSLWLLRRIMRHP
ncbi:glycosyltransferase [Candidatus Viridilinea mediisalina]|uniref:glycosyltransferase n=1 Tax=Candidatus Viridilinea mediisalina TaxID=2024553 RepID=UPI0013FDCB02|nr:glycosyltransferase [Candidatus Viridilinea mediisalina]